EPCFEECVHERRRAECTVERQTNGLVATGLNEQRRSRRKDDFMQDVKAVGTGADDPPEMLRKKQGVLHVGAAFVPRGATRSERQVELIVAVIGAVRDEMMTRQ